MRVKHTNVVFFCIYVPEDVSSSALHSCRTDEHGHHQQVDPSLDGPRTPFMSLQTGGYEVTNVRTIGRM